MMTSLDVYIKVSDATMKSRLLKRAETSGRVDDNEETIVKRLKVFHDLTTPVVEYYGKQNKVSTVSILHSILRINSQSRCLLS